MRHCNARFEESSISPAEQSARREVRMLRRFYNHLAIYLIVNSALLAFHFLNASDHTRWPFVAVGWGIALAIHGLRVAFRNVWLNAGWEEAKVQAILNQQAKAR